MARCHVRRDCGSDGRRVRAGAGSQAAGGCAGACAASRASSDGRRSAAGCHTPGRDPRSDSAGAPRRQPQSPDPRRGAQSGQAAGNAARSFASRRTPSRGIRPHHAGVRQSSARRLVRRRGTPTLLEKVRSQLEGEVALGLTFQGSYSQTKPKDPAYGGHASAMGPAPANIAVARRRRARAGDLRSGCAAAVEDVLRRPDQGPHPRIGLRRRRPVRLRRRWAARHLSGHRRRARRRRASASRIAMRSIATSADGSSRTSRSRRAWISRRGAAARAPAISTATAASISTSPTGDRTRCSATVATARSRMWPPRAGVAAGGWSTGCTFFDADGDGDLDLYVARYVETTWDSVVASAADARLAQRAAHHGRPGRTSRRVRSVLRERRQRTVRGGRPTRTASPTVAGLRLRRRGDRLRRRRVRRSVRRERLEPEFPVSQPRERPLRKRRTGRGRGGERRRARPGGHGRRRRRLRRRRADGSGAHDVRARSLHAVSQPRRPALRGREHVRRASPAPRSSAWAGARPSSTPTSTASSICSSPTATSSRTSTSSRSLAKPTARRTSCS